MNERIKELGKLSRDYAYATEVDSTGYIDPKTDERLTWFDLYERKLAELIVQECVKILVTGEGNENTSDAVWDLEELGVDVSKILNTIRS